MPKDAFNPNAYLSQTRNLRTGLTTRTKVLNAIENGKNTAREIAIYSRISYFSSIYHLHLLEREKIISCRGRRPFRWRLTGFGQQKLEG